MLLPLRTSSLFSRSLSRLPAFCKSACAAIGLAALLAGCTPGAPPPPALDAPAPHQLSADKPDFLTLPNQAKNATPARIGIILPFHSSSAPTRALAEAMMNAAQLALYQSGRSDLILMSADDGGAPANAAHAARKLLDQGAEILLGPIFSTSVRAAAPVARDRGVPMIAFSTDRSVAGDGIYLLSFQPESEVTRVMAQARAKGHRKFAAMIPQTAYGTLVEQILSADIKAHGGTLVAVERYSPTAAALNAPAARIAKSGCDAVLIPQGGDLLRTLVSVLAFNGLSKDKVQLLGTGVWNDDANQKDSLLAGGWFAAPPPKAGATFEQLYRRHYGEEPPALASLAYDAVTLAATLAPGQPYHRYTKQTLTDPAGFSGVDGIFRFRANGSLERGLAVLAIAPTGFTVVSPAPKLFERARPRS